MAESSRRSNQSQWMLEKGRKRHEEGKRKRGFPGSGDGATGRSRQVVGVRAETGGSWVRTGTIIESKRILNKL